MTLDTVFYSAYVWLAIGDDLRTLLMLKTREY